MKGLNIIFLIANWTALVGWALLIIFPREKFTDTTILSVIAIILSLIYGYVLFFQKNPKGEKFIKGSFWTMRGVSNLFKNTKVTLMGWVHFLVFDLIVGLYIKNDALQNDINFWMIIPCLLLTLMFGPLGFLAYFLLKLVVL